MCFGSFGTLVLDRLEPCRDACNRDGRDDDDKTRRDPVQNREDREKKAESHRGQDYKQNSAVLSGGRYDDGEEHSVDGNAEGADHEGGQDVSGHCARECSQHPSRDGYTRDAVVVGGRQGAVKARVQRKDFVCHTVCHEISVPVRCTAV